MSLRTAILPSYELSYARISLSCVRECESGFVKIHGEMAHLEIRFERRFGDLIKWSFVFCVGAVGAIAALAGVLR